MHDLKARERGLETELHVARRSCLTLQETNRRLAEQLVGPPVRVQRPTWRGWFKLIFRRRFWRPVWEVQIFDSVGAMIWYSHQLRGLMAILTAEAIVRGERLQDAGDRRDHVKVRDVGSGRVAWIGRIKLTRGAWLDAPR